MTFGDRLKEFCLKKWSSLGDAANALNMHQTDLSRYINNKVEPKLSFLTKMSNVGCDINWLLGKEVKSISAFRVNEEKVQYGVFQIKEEYQRELIKQEADFYKRLLKELIEEVKTRNSLDDLKELASKLYIELDFDKIK